MRCQAAGLRVTWWPRRFEGGDVAADVGGGVSSVEVVGAEFVVVGVVGEEVPDDDDHGVGDREDRLVSLLVPMRRLNRRNCAAR